MSKPLSVVTICYNAADVLLLTVESVLGQDFTDFEYVIQDGGSSDETARIIESYRERFESKGITFKFNSAPDGGIYDAMNKGAAASSGEFINYMNAGDCFYGADVLGKVADVIKTSRAEGKDPAIIYGDCAVYEYGRFYMFQKCPERIEETMPFSHQTVFARRDMLLTHPFDTSLRYSADYDFLLTMHDINAEFADAKTIVCIASADGLTSVHYRDTLMESEAILNRHDIHRHSKEEIARTARILALKQFVLDHFPIFVKKFIRGRQIKNRGQDFSPVIPVWFSDHIK